MEDGSPSRRSEPPSPLTPGKGKAVVEPSRCQQRADAEAFMAQARSSLPLLARLEKLLEVKPIPFPEIPFLTKTYDVVDDPNTDTVVSWGATGNSFVVWKPHVFLTEILPRYFQHSNLFSFVCLLNTYGFRKVHPDRWEFANEGFQRGRRELLKTIKCRHSLSSPSSLQQGQAPSSCLELEREMEWELVENMSAVIYFEYETPDKIQLGSNPGFGFGDYPLHRPKRSYRKPHQPSAPISAERCNSYGESGSYYGRRPERLAFRHGVLNQGSTPTSDVNAIATTAGAGTSTGGHTLGNLLATDGGGGPGHLESHGSSHNSTGGGEPDMEAGLGGAAPAQQTSVIGGGESDLEAGLGGATPPQRRPSVNEQEAAKTFREFFNQAFAGTLVASAITYVVLKDAPKHVKIILFVGHAVIFIVMFAAILYTELAYRRMAFLVVSGLAFALLAFSFASQL